MTLFWRISEMLAVTQASENVVVLGTLQFVYLLDFNCASNMYFMQSTCSSSEPGGLILTGQSCALVLQALWDPQQLQPTGERMIWEG